jgi:hypothetical protein
MSKKPEPKFQPGDRVHIPGSQPRAGVVLGVDDPRAAKVLRSFNYRDAPVLWDDDGTVTCPYEGVLRPELAEHEV